LKKLVSTNEASKLLGLSVQGIHYRIKKGQLESIKKDGKTFVYIQSDTSTNTKTTISTNQDLIKVKDEQILLLKDTINWMKKQYKQEIKRLSKNQANIIDVFKGEITLLQQAYTEMKTLHQLSNKTALNGDEFNILSVQEFFIKMKKHNKTNTQIKSIILDRIKNNDKRFIYNNETKELLIYDSDFIDLI
jgi:hypothetical protein